MKFRIFGMKYLRILLKVQIQGMNVHFFYIKLTATTCSASF
jgi:hypothetical protein